MRYLQRAPVVVVELAVFLGVGFIPGIDTELLATGFSVDEVENES